MAVVLENHDIKKLIERNQGQCSELNSALISAAAIWGVKTSELSLIEVSDLVTSKGEIKPKWQLRQEISFNGYPRELYADHNCLMKYLKDYLYFRKKNNHGTTNQGEYMGLDPESKLFLDENGKAFYFSRRSATDEGKTNLQPMGMNKYFKRLIDNACITGLSYKDFRSSLAINMHRAGEGNVRLKKKIMELLGIRSYESLMKMVNTDPKSIHDMVKGVYNRI